MTAPILELDGVRKTYGRTVALERVDLRVEPGELVGLLGHNGAGKSTLLQLVSGQVLPGEGTIRVAGIDVREDPDGARRRMGVVPETPQLWDYLTAREFLELVRSLRGGGDLDAALALAGLDGDADRLVREYSQGMRRKTAIAAACLARPPLLVFDEAINGLDPDSAARVKAHLRARCDEGAAVLLSTHVLETVERLADRVVVLHHGRVIHDTPAAGVDLEALFASIRK